jgi:prepilin-type processing-associated H-X9-DG protein
LAKPVFPENTLKAFTSIELLVVIAILTAMLLPARTRAKMKATRADCLSNQQQLCMAFKMYATDFSDYIEPVAGGDGYWTVPATLTWNQTGQSSETSMAHFQSWVGKSANNPLIPFANNIAVIHCPGDVRLKNVPGRGWAYDSYSKPNGIAADPYNNFWGQDACYTKLSQVDSAALTFAFREGDDNRGYNEGSWVVNWILGSPSPGHAQSFTWEDPILMFHGKACTAGFCDGHAEFHKWINSGIINYGKSIASGTCSFTPPAVTCHSNYDYVSNGYRFPSWKP